MKYFFSIDWGTSSLRVRLIDIQGNTLNILYEKSDHNGISNVNESYNNKNGKSREEHFLSFLQPFLVLPDSLTKEVSVPVIISGMATSSIGIREIPYSQLPFNLDGSDLNYEVIPRTDNFNHDVLLLSGLSSSKDVMRGEEVQLLGLQKHHTESLAALFILPGTHSKHILIQNNQVVSFNTYITGEMFKLLSTYSLLKNNITKPDTLNQDSFKLGLTFSKTTILNSAFMIRAMSLLQKNSDSCNYSLLSGILIGQELNELRNIEAPIYLCAHENLSDSYTLAMQELSLQNRCTVISPKMVDESVIYGQMLLLKRIWNKQC